MQKECFSKIFVRKEMYRIDYSVNFALADFLHN